MSILPVRMKSISNSSRSYIYSHQTVTEQKNKMFFPSHGKPINLLKKKNQSNLPFLQVTTSTVFGSDFND